MKRKIGELRGTPIIEGDKNLKANKEIHISDLKGGGSGSGSGEVVNGVKYYSCDNSSVMSVLGEWGILAKRVYENEIKIATVYVLEASNYKTANLAVSIDWNMEIVMDGKVETVRERFESITGTTIEEFVAQYNIIEITKEQFYNLEA